MENGNHRNGNSAIRERERLDFSKIKSSIQIPNLIEVQRLSYQRFLQMDLLPSEREDTGLQETLIGHPLNFDQVGNLDGALDLRKIQPCALA